MADGEREEASRTSGKAWCRRCPRGEVMLMETSALPSHEIRQCQRSLGGSEVLVHAVRQIAACENDNLARAGRPHRFLRFLTQRAVYSCTPTVDTDITCVSSDVQLSGIVSYRRTYLHERSCMMRWSAQHSAISSTQSNIYRSVGSACAEVSGSYRLRISFLLNNQSAS